MKREHIEALTGLYDAASAPRPPSWPARAGLVLLGTLLGLLAVLGVVDLVGAVLP